MTTTETRSTSPSMIEPLLTAGDVAQLLRISQRSVWRFADQGLVPPPIRIGRAVRWRPEELRAWLDAKGMRPKRFGP